MIFFEIFPEPKGQPQGIALSLALDSNFRYYCMKPYSLIYIIIFSILLTNWSGATYAADNPEKLHREALELARAGGDKLNQALVMFEELVATYPKKLDIFYDYLVVLTWANQDSWALRELHKVNLEKAPAYLLETTPGMPCPLASGLKTNIFLASLLLA